MNFDNFADDEIYEQLMNMTIHEILEKRSVSYRLRNMIDKDNFWCRLLKRDHGVSQYKDCQQTYNKHHSNKILLSRSIDFYYEFETFTNYLSVIETEIMYNINVASGHNEEQSVSKKIAQIYLTYLGHPTGIRSLNPFEYKFAQSIETISKLINKFNVKDVSIFKQMVESLINNHANLKIDKFMNQLTHKITEVLLRLSDVTKYKSTFVGGDYFY
jgi:hypothetical protein